MKKINKQQTRKRDNCQHRAVNLGEVTLLLLEGKAVREDQTSHERQMMVKAREGVPGRGTASTDALRQVRAWHAEGTGRRAVG